MIVSPLKLICAGGFSTFAMPAADADREFSLRWRLGLRL